MAEPTFSRAQHGTAEPVISSFAPARIWDGCGGCWGMSRGVSFVTVAWFVGGLG
jgi:hypothetical protein